MVAGIISYHNGNAEARLVDYCVLEAQTSPLLVGDEDSVTKASDGGTDSECPLAQLFKSEDTTIRDKAQPPTRNLPQIPPQVSSKDISQSARAQSTVGAESSCSVSVLELLHQDITEKPINSTSKVVPTDKKVTSATGSQRVTYDANRAVDCRELSKRTVEFDLKMVIERQTLLNSNGVGRETEEDGSAGDKRRFRAKINPASNSQAEEELRKQIRYKTRKSAHITNRSVTVSVGNLTSLR